MSRDVYKANPTIKRRVIEDIEIFEVQDVELSQLVELGAAEKRALGFFTFAFGVVMSVTLSWATSPPAKDNVAGLVVLCVALGLGGVCCVWFGTTWAAARKSTTALLLKIRERKERVREASGYPISYVQATSISVGGPRGTALIGRKDEEDEREG